MENEHVISGLTRKRGEIAGEIERTQHLLRKLVTELDAIDQAIRIFDPNADIGKIKTHHYPQRHAAFRGEMMRFVLDSQYENGFVNTSAARMPHACLPNSCTNLQCHPCSSNDPILIYDGEAL